MGEATQVLGGALGFLTGLARASQQLRQQKAQERLALLQLLGRDPGREITVASPEERRPTNPFQRLLGAGQFQATGGSPVVELGGTPIVARARGAEGLVELIASLTPEQQQDGIIQALVRSGQDPRDIALKVAQRSEQLTLMQQKTQLQEEQQGFRRSAETRSQAGEERAQAAEKRAQDAAKRAERKAERPTGAVAKLDEVKKLRAERQSLLDEGVSPTDVRIQDIDALIDVTTKGAGGTDLQFDESGRLTRATVGGRARPAPVDKVVLRQQEDKLDAIEEARGLMQSLSNIVRPENVGIIGQLRGTTQNLIKTGGALGAAFQSFSGTVQNDIASGRTDPAVGKLFDTSIPAITFMERELAYSVARSREKGGRLSIDDIREAQASLGLQGLLSNPERIRGSLQALSATLNRRERIARERLGMPKITPEQMDQRLQEAGIEDEAQRLQLIIEGRDRGLVEPWAPGGDIGPLEITTPPRR